MEEKTLQLPDCRSQLEEIFRTETPVISLDPDALDQALFGKTSCFLYRFEGELEAFDAALAAVDLHGREIVFQLTQWPDMDLDELESWANLIADAAGPDANTAFGVDWSEELDDGVCIVNILAV